MMIAFRPVLATSRAMEIAKDDFPSFGSAEEIMITFGGLLTSDSRRLV
jgi:hypothetical protein